MPSILSFDEDFFSCIDHTTDKLVSGHKYLYTEVADIVMRVRPEHADIRYWPVFCLLICLFFILFDVEADLIIRFNGKERFRMMSSYLQIITNELVLRSKESNHEIQVIFEPQSRKFDVYRIYLHPFLFS
jgi:hypothetical protein